jgi:hypothetical protein
MGTLSTLSAKFIKNGSMFCIADRDVHEEHFTDFHPDAKAATKGGSPPGISPVLTLKRQTSLARLSPARKESRDKAKVRFKV